MGIFDKLREKAQMSEDELKQNVNGKTRSDHRALMDAMIRLYSAYKESLEKKSMGFSMSEWDEKLLKYGHLFETKLMDLRVNIPLEDALVFASETKLPSA